MLLKTSAKKIFQILYQIKSAHQESGWRDFSNRKFAFKDSFDRGGTSFGAVFRTFTKDGKEDTLPRFLEG